MRYKSCSECQQPFCDLPFLGEDRRRAFCWFLINEEVDKAVQKIIERVSKRKERHIDIANSQLKNFLHFSRN